MKIGLDVDGVLANFPAGVIDRARMMGFGDEFPKCCHDVPAWHIAPRFSEVMKDAWMDPSFWLRLPPLPDRPDFTPDCYITSRPIANWVTEEWLSIHDYPKADVITVSKPEEKYVHIAERRLDLFIDDYYVTVQGLLDRGIACLLWEAPYQRGHDISLLPCIANFNEVKGYESFFNKSARKRGRKKRELQIKRPA